MRFKLIACEVFYREVCLCIAESPHIIDVEFTEKGAHDKSDFLRELIQKKIDEAENAAKKYDAILLAFGLCGNSTIGLTAKNTRLVLPRAHDCCTIFLGSKHKFKELFGDNPSQPFSSAGYIERGESYFHDASMLKSIGMDKTYEEYVALYGEENAKFLMETLSSSLNKGEGGKVVYIEIPETAHLGFAEKCKIAAESEGKEFMKVEGSMRLIKKLIFGEWDTDEFLVVEPEQKIAGVYDMDEVIKAEEKNN
jgi:hypothetical protein